jgi:hypothetical protein
MKKNEQKIRRQGDGVRVECGFVIMGLPVRSDFLIVSGT